MSVYDRIDALDALTANVAWREMVDELNERKEMIVRALVAETTPPDERDHLATEYRLIETFIAWPGEYRRELEGTAE